MKPLLIIFFIFITSNCFCQSHSFYSDLDTLSIDSEIFGTIRKITVSIPKDYDRLKQAKNCILYVDGDDEEITATILQATNNLYLYDDIPQSILVGVIHENRDQELQEKNKLYDFISTEVLPVISEKYILKEEITIVGHSFGAYFATYCFLKNNKLFNNCVAISPSYWPNQNDIYTIAEQELEQQGNLTGNFYLAIGDKRWDDISLRDGVFKFKSMIERDERDFNFRYNDLIGFNHNSSPTVGFGLGLNFCFDEWEWGSVVEEQNSRIESFPDFWRHYELKADALSHLNRTDEAIETYKISIEKLKLDKEITATDRNLFLKRLEDKIGR
ncbi:alpha/beta hydrolase [Algoriphagus marinus]|uniref:alpha/beta hydrolase n=1 Tax=Algoriphagus marinus TaxID=1925762 RepID=UPI00094B9C2D|nr:alpha/beta hydrolase-fold protein [Algoriphagus marinus]